MTTGKENQIEGADKIEYPTFKHRMKLILEDGTEFQGRSFGAECEVRGEVVFNTGMTGYVETLTDPSYRGQILVMTYPLQNNYGVPEGPFESERVQVQGLVVSRYTHRHSHYAAVKSLGDWLREGGVPAIEGVDTRTLTRHLRENGTIPGWLLFDGSGLAKSKLKAKGVEMNRAAAEVSLRDIVHYPGSAGAPSILVIDTGVKSNIVRSLLRRGASVVRVPFMAQWEEFVPEADGIVIGNGPGDPRLLGPLIEKVRRLLASGKPLFGIFLGHQLMALAAGARTYKLKYGHRSQNQPVVDRRTGRAYITSQNHGYAVRGGSIPKGWRSWFENINDRTNEGLRHSRKPFFSVQFHPEAAAGPHDTEFLFDRFLDMVRGSAR